MKRSGKIPLKKAQELRKKGVAWKDIGTILGCNGQSARLALKKAGMLEPEPKVVVEPKPEPMAPLPAQDIEDVQTIGKPEQVEKMSPIPSQPPPSTTKPWNQEENPWRPDIFRLQKKRPGFVNRFSDPDPEILRRHLNEGWQIAERQYYGGRTDNPVDAENQTGSQVLSRGMILMEMTEALFEQRQEYFKRKTDGQTAEAKQIAKDTAQSVGRAADQDMQMEAKYIQDKRLGGAGRPI